MIVPRVINRHFFSRYEHYKYKIKNLRFFKTLEFCTFSDINTPEDYELLRKILSKMDVSESVLISIGSKPPPFGVHFNPEALLEKEKEEMLSILLNSCRFSFVMNRANWDKTFNWIVSSVIATCIPILFFNDAVFTKCGVPPLFPISTSEEQICNNINIILKNYKNYEYWIYKLSKKYKRGIDKWIKIPKNKK